MPPKAKPAATPSTAAGDLSLPLSLEEKINHIFNTVNKIDSTLSDQQVRVAKLESEVGGLNEEVLTLKNIVNSHEQQLRSSIIRITGFPLTEDEKLAKNSSALAARVFDRIIGPILNLAASNGLMDFAPTAGNTIASCYRIGNPAAAASADSPPPLIVKLRSSEIRVNILRCKREAVFGPTEAEKADGCRFFMIAEDLTQPAFKKLKEMKSREEVAKAWTVEGRILFSLTGSKIVNRVASVFEDIETILSNAKA